MEPHPQSALRAQLTDLIELERPPWTQLIPRGRKETVDYIGTDVKQCLKDAGSRRQLRCGDRRVVG